MMFRKSLIALFSLSSVLLFAQEIPLLQAWSSYVGDSWTSGDGVTALAAGENGTLYGVGYLGNGWQVIDNNCACEIQTLEDGFGEDQLVFGVSPNGALRWATMLVGDAGDDRLYGVSISEGILYVVGNRYPSNSYPKECTYGMIHAIDTFTGTTHWNESLQVGRGLGSTNALFSVATMPDGGGVAVGYTSCPNEAMGVPAYSVNGTEYGMVFQGELDGIVVRFSAGGEILWKRYLGGKLTDKAYACAVDAQGNIYVAGETYSSGWETVESGNPISTRPSGFFTKLSSTGAHLWTRYFCANGSISIRGIGIAPQENALYLIGQSSGILTHLGTGCTVKNSLGGAEDGFLLKCIETEEGLHVPNWIRYIGGTGIDSATGISFDKKGRPVVCGDTGRPFFASTDGSSPGGTTDGYALIFPTDGGESVWRAYMGGVVAEHASSVVGTSQGLVAAGTTRSSGWIHGGFWVDGTRTNNDTGKPYPAGEGPTYGFLYSWQEPRPPALKRDLADVTIADGESATFSLEATGSQPLFYYWGKNGNWVTRPSQEAEWKTAPMTMSDNGALFQCVVSNVSCVVTSRVATVTVTNRVPVISGQPKDLSVLDGGSAEFTIVASAGSVLPDFSWYRDGKQLPNEISQILTLPKVEMPDSGAKFFCVVSNPSGVVTSDVATLTVEGLKPSIISQPQPVTVREGSPATFTVQAKGGSSTLYYQWYRDKKLINGANAEAYTLVTSLADNGAHFSCMVSNVHDFVESASALLTVTEKPKGRLTVTLAPDPALVRGAAWSIDQGENWLGSASSQDLREGSYQVSFKEIEAFQTPAATNLMVKSGETTAITVHYVPIAVSCSVLRSIASTNITLTVTPPVGTPFWGVTEQLPEGVTVVASAGGYWDAQSRQLTFTGVVSTQLVYTVSVESVGPYSISGTFYPYGGIEEVVGGNSEISLSSAIRSVFLNRVMIQVAPPPGTKPFVWALEEQLPNGVVPTDLVGPGVAWDPLRRTITWVMLGGDPASCAYTLTGNPGTYTVSGRITFGEAYDAVTGLSQVTIPKDENPEPTIQIPVPSILSFSKRDGNHWSILFVSTQNVEYAVQTNKDLTSSSWGTLQTVLGEPEQTQIDVKLEEKTLFLRIKAE